MKSTAATPQANPSPACPYKLGLLRLLGAIKAADDMSALKRTAGQIKADLEKQ